ncbi:hypothetical protein [Kingella oralis]|nr:hypothetical protein [Kingella oralis]
MLPFLYGQRQRRNPSNPTQGSLKPWQNLQSVEHRRLADIANQ